MNEQSGGAFLVIAGVVAVIMAVKGSWNEVWGELTGKRTGKTARTAASYSTAPGAVLIDSAGGTGSGSGPDSAPGPLARAV